MDITNDGRRRPTWLGEALMVQLEHGVLEVSRRDLVDVPTRSARIHETLVSELWLDFDDAVRGCSPDDIVETDH